MHTNVPCVDELVKVCLRIGFNNKEYLLAHKHSVVISIRGFEGVVQKTASV